MGSSATASEGKQNLLCAYLAAALLVGLLGNALVGAWWLDGIVALFIAVVAVQEGREAWKATPAPLAEPARAEGAHLQDIRKSYFVSALDRLAGGRLMLGSRVRH